MKKKFIHLRSHSEYSIYDGLLSINKIIEISKKDNQKCFALTDLSNLFGSIKFYNLSIKNKIKPIIGCDVWIKNNNDKPTRLLLLSKNFKGYLQLCKLISKAWLKKKNKYPEIKIKWLEKLNYKNNKNNLIALSGADLGNIGIEINNNNIKKAEIYAKNWNLIFPNSFYIEIQRINQINMDLQIYKSIDLAYKLNLPIVATHPIQFNLQSDFLIHEAKICILNNNFLFNKNKKKFNKNQNFKTQLEMYNLFSDIPEAIKNTIEISKKCNLILKYDKLSLQKFPIFKNKNYENILKKKSIKGLKKRLNFIFKNKKKKYIYKKRLNFELNTIIKTGFCQYFLIVSDFVKWAKKNKIPVGPGRGSSAGSLIAYVLYITDINPIIYNLLFERFLNEKRISLPDFDIDFCQNKRNKVINYVKNKYGKHNVAQIITFGTIGAKCAIRDIGRILGLNYNFCNNLIKKIFIKSNEDINIDNIINNNIFLKKEIKNNWEIKQLMYLAKKIEGTIRNIGIHAGGILISPKKLINFCPLYYQNKNNEIISQYDKDDIENLGLIKFDFLGLTTLSIINKTIKNIKYLNNIKKFNLKNIKYNNKLSFKLLNKANTIAIFQLESKGMRNMLKIAKPNCIQDIIALISLYRPGPINLIYKFCERKNGKKFKYPDNKIKNILKETYGIMIYQEQVMQISQIIGNYSLEEADILRRIISKKNKKEMLKQNLIFKERALKNNINIKKINKIFNLIKEFAGYGFNKSHATAYAILSYQTIYLKTNYTVEFMSANLSYSMNNIEKIKILIYDSINKCNINILPPHINLSKYDFLPIIIKKKKYIRYGLGAIKNLGEKAIKEILKIRKINKFKNFFDFINKINKQKINKRKIEALIYSGALDCFKKKRNILKASIKKAFEYSEYKKKFLYQKKIFICKEYNLYKKKKKINIKKYLEKEKKTIGIYLSFHPFNFYKKEINKFNIIKIKKIKKKINNIIITSGIIINNKIIYLKQKKNYIISLEDNYKYINILLNKKILKYNNIFLKNGKFIILKLLIIKNFFLNKFSIIIKKIMNMNTLKKKFIKYIIIYLSKKIFYKKIKKFFINKYENKMNCIIYSENSCIINSLKKFPNQKLKKYLFNLDNKNLFLTYY